MNAAAPRRDLVVLVSDRDIEFALRGVLHRAGSLGIREVTADFHMHLGRDPGCFRKAHDFLRPSVNQYAHAIVAFDREGSGRDQWSRQQLEHHVEDLLAKNGWGDRAAAVVMDPELEVWVWSDSPHVDVVLGWKDKQPDLKTWLNAEGFARPTDVKPERPKEAMEQALRLAQKPRSSSLYEQLAECVSLDRCTDPAFLKLKRLLQEWFGRPET